ncbi:PTS glucose transporter subunit IIA [Erysipelotrichaceae bacterium RD49]|nr:PTS glucose transporter subunit IIA [Erysipelotrichaceae bacterium RD49]
MNYSGDTKDTFEQAKKEYEATEEANMKAADDYHDLFAWADGDLLAYPYSDPNASDQDKMMQTLITMKVKDQNINAPVSGTVISVDPKQNIIVIQTPMGNRLGLKICTGAVDFEKDAKILVSPGQKVREGDTLVHFIAPVEAKSKLFAIDSVDKILYQEGYQPRSELGKVSQGEPLLSRPAQ